MEHSENSIVIRGELCEPPRFSHENHFKRFYRFELAVARLSGAVDTLPVVCDAALLDGLTLCGGETLEICGQIRSHNLRENGTRRLLIFVFAASVEPAEGEPCNDVTLRGVLCKQPTLRRTPLGRDICDVMLAVPRAFRRADYLPCILWGRTAQQLAACQTGDTLRIQGRLQSRSYVKQMQQGSETRATYEISALSAEAEEK